MGRITGLSAFPLTPIIDDGIDEPSFVGLVERLVSASVDSVVTLGSTGSYAYLDRAERRRVVELADRSAGAVPVLAGVGATRTRDVLRHAEDAQAAGADGLLLAPVTYQVLSDEEVFGLFADVDAAVSVPVVVYDNPGTTHVTFSDELHARISELRHVTSIKIPPVTGGPEAIRRRVDALRARVSSTVSIGISGDPVAADALGAGCEVWYSVLAGTLPLPCRLLVDAVVAGDVARAQEVSAALTPVWELFDAHGSYRVVAALAEELGLVGRPSLPRPVLGLDATGRAGVGAAIRSLRDAGLLDADD